MNYCHQCGSELDGDYCEACEVYYVEVAEKDSLTPEQQSSEKEDLLDKKTNVRRREKVSISFMVIGILLASSGSIVPQLKYSLWITGALLMSAGLISLLVSYSKAIETEKEIKTIEAYKDLIHRKSDPFYKGCTFETYASSLFPVDCFTLVDVTPHRQDLNGRWVESKLNPDFKIRHEPDGPTFWVECKYRSKLYNGMLRWSDYQQHDRYRRFQKERPNEKMYILIGLGGQPENPESVYLIPLDNIPTYTLEPSFFESYRLPTSVTFGYSDDKLTWRVSEHPIKENP